MGLVPVKVSMRRSGLRELTNLGESKPAFLRLPLQEHDCQLILSALFPSRSHIIMTHLARVGSSLQIRFDELCNPTFHLPFYFPARTTCLLD
jgi:hypothetical protein